MLMSPSGWVSNLVTVSVESSNSVTQTLTISTRVTTVIEVSMYIHILKAQKVEI